MGQVACQSQTFQIVPEESFQLQHNTDRSSGKTNNIKFDQDTPSPVSAWFCTRDLFYFYIGAHKVEIKSCTSCENRSVVSPRLPAHINSKVQACLIFFTQFAFLRI